MISPYFFNTLTPDTDGMYIGQLWNKNYEYSSIPNLTALRQGPVRGRDGFIDGFIGITKYRDSSGTLSIKASTTDHGDILEYCTYLVDTGSGRPDRVSIPLEDVKFFWDYDDRPVWVGVVNEDSTKGIYYSQEGDVWTKGRAQLNDFNNFHFSACKFFYTPPTYRSPECIYAIIADDNSLTSGHVWVSRRDGGLVGENWEFICRINNYASACVYSYNEQHVAFFSVVDGLPNLPRNNPIPIWSDNGGHTWEQCPGGVGNGRLLRKNTYFNKSYLTLICEDGKAIYSFASTISFDDVNFSYPIKDIDIVGDFWFIMDSNNYLWYQGVADLISSKWFKALDLDEHQIKIFRHPTFDSTWDSSGGSFLPKISYHAPNLWDYPLANPPDAEYLVIADNSTKPNYPQICWITRKSLKSGLSNDPQKIPHWNRVDTIRKMGDSSGLDMLINENISEYLVDVHCVLPIYFHKSNIRWLISCSFRVPAEILPGYATVEVVVIGYGGGIFESPISNINAIVRSISDPHSFLLCPNECEDKVVAYPRLVELNHIKGNTYYSSVEEV